MAIPLTTNQESEIAEKVKKPRHLVEIILGAQTIRVCTGDTIVWNGNTYQKAGLKVSDVKLGKAGTQQCRITLLDEDHVWKKLAVQTGFEFRQVTIWEVYGEQPYAEDDPLKIFYGEIVQVPSLGNKIVFDCMTCNAAQARVPFILLGAPAIKHLPRPGQQVLIGTELYTVEIN